MATITVTQAGTTVAVKNGDHVVIDIPGGGDVTVVAANPGARNFQVSFTDDNIADTLRIDLSTFQSNNLQILARDYDPTDRVVLLGSTQGAVNPAKLNEYEFNYVGATGQTHDGRVRLLDKDERDLSSNPPPIIICFAAGTRIATEHGARAVERLVPGDLVETADHGLQPVRWAGSKHLGPEDLDASPHLAPVLIRQGAMGAGLPVADLLVSPQHRIRVSDWRAQLLFGEPEVLVPAKALIDGVRILEARTASVTYCHILFDRHELVRANGLLCESLHPGEMALEAMDEGTWDVILGRSVDPTTDVTARLALRYRDARAFAVLAV